VNADMIQKLIDSKKRLLEDYTFPETVKKNEEEGGCGVVGFCCTEPVPGRHIYAPSVQMHNRGNGKGGGIAAVGMVPEQLGVSRKVLDEYYMLHIALLDTTVQAEVEQRYITGSKNSVRTHGLLTSVIPQKVKCGTPVEHILSQASIWRLSIMVILQIITRLPNT